MRVSFYKLKEKPLLEPDDVKVRRTWATKWKRRSKEVWVSKPKAIIDNKHFEATRCAKSREYVARRSCRGAYQRKGAPPKKCVIKPKAGMNKVKFPGVQVTAAVVKGKIRMWKYVEGNWRGDAAAAMYQDLEKVLKKAYPHHHGRYEVLEDNDPTGYKSSKGMAAKAACNLKTDDLPKRSPDLNVLDYCLWHEINVRMRAQERAFPKSKRETMDEFKARLRKTALGLPTALVKKAVGSMKRRCQIISKNKGELFTE